MRNIQEKLRKGRREPAAAGLLMLLVLISVSAGAQGWPSSDQTLNYMEVDLYTSTYPTYYDRVRNARIIVGFRMNTDFPDPIVTDEEFLGSYTEIPDPPETFKSAYQAENHFSDFLTYYQTENPETLIGTYISGRDCQTSATYYPVETVACSALTECFDDPENLEPGRYWVDISKQSCADQFADLIVAEAQARGLPFLYLDNIIHPSSGGLDGTEITWQNMVTHLQTVRSRLNAQNIRLVANVAGSPWLFSLNSYEDADLLDGAADGMSFELPFNRRFARPYFDRMISGMAVYKRWLADGKLILFIPVPGETQEERLQEKQFIAAMVMLMRDSGQAGYVDSWYWTDEQNFPWRLWPGKYGAPSGAAESLVQTTYGWKTGRVFANGKIGVLQVNATEDKKKTFTLSDASSFTLVSEPLQGTVDISALPTISYTPGKDFDGTDGFTLGADWDEEHQIFRNLLVVNVYVANCDPPLILSWTSTPRVLPMEGGTATLSWLVSDATSTVINPGGVSVSPLEGTYDVTVPRNTKYTLVASNACGSSSQDVGVAVYCPLTWLPILLEDD